MGSKEQNFTCSVCNKMFKKKIYLNKHNREIHKINCKGEQLLDENKFYCGICNKTFTRKNALQNHVNSVHFPNLEETKKYKCKLCTYFSRHKGTFNRHLIKHKNEETMSERMLFNCNHCDASFKYKTHLQRHHSKSHAKWSVKRKCPICPFTSVLKSRKEIINHFEQIHTISLNWENHEFQSMDEFNQWRKEQEQKNKTCYTRRVYSINSMSYVCHRNGFYQAKGCGKRSLKITGSAKINGFCPAEIKINTDKKGCVRVKYLSTHVGHKNDVEHLRLTKEDKEMIISQLVNRKPHDEILENIRNSVTGCDLQRYHLITRKDIQNIENSFNLNKGTIRRRHLYTFLNANAGIKEVENSRDTALRVTAESGECDSGSSGELESAACEPDHDTQLKSKDVLDNMQGRLEDTVISVRSRDQVEAESIRGIPVNEEDTRVNVNSTKLPNTDGPEEDNQSRRVILCPENTAQVEQLVFNTKTDKSENKQLEVLPDVIATDATQGDKSGRTQLLQTGCPNTRPVPSAQTATSGMTATGKPGSLTNNNIGKCLVLQVNRLPSTEISEKPPSQHLAPSFTILRSSKHSLNPPATDLSPDTLTVSLAQFEEPTRTLLRDRINQLVGAVASGKIDLKNLIFASRVTSSP